MSRRSKQIPGLYQKVKDYAENRLLDLHQYSDYHYRLTDSGYVTLDFWTTGRYYVLTTDYGALEADMVERAGEKGHLPMNKLSEFLDNLFFVEVAK